MLTLFLIAAARRLNTALIEQTRLRFEYPNLFEDLSDDKHKIENLNNHLASEVNARVQYRRTTTIRHPGVRKRRQS